jgi:hypothetical protein
MLKKPTLKRELFQSCFLDGIKQLIFVMEIRCIFFEAGTEILNID